VTQTRPESLAFLQDFRVLSLSQADLTHVHCIHTAFHKQNGRARRQSLIEQNLDHATRSIPRLSSATVAAA
jgi:hypothetical protein